ncbi:MAG: 4Fe-4S dicluster domain-containing protein [Gammaproteobacteria bacterium]|nr:4Fe-4S dicluster domain-containing protein [Gammaproteobacteria bacterium]MDH3872406.1 4Fe-4S dicluster domain-containing protein [Gammaproteobacteria bacterium]
MSDSSDSPVSRRKFLKKVSQGAAAVATAGVAAGAMHATASKPSADSGKKDKVQYGMLIDLRRCIGCQACTVACKAEADVPMGVSRSWVEYVEKGRYPNTGRSFLPRLCNHCSQPHCVRVCPTGATYERPQDGLVVIDQGVCIGCLYCAQACPYGMRFLNPVTRFADKCDMCIHRVSKGLVPSCVNTCQGRARIFGDVNDPNSEIHQLIARNPVSVIRETYGTQPNVYYIGLDTTDENTAKPGQYVRVTTNRGPVKRRV